MTRRASRSSRSSLCCCAKVRQKSDLPQKMCHRCVITPQCSRRKIARCCAVGCKLTNFPIKTLQKRHDKEFKKKSEPSKCWFPCAFVPLNVARARSEYCAITQAVLRTWLRRQEVLRGICAHLTNQVWLAAQDCRRKDGREDDCTVVHTRRQDARVR